MAAEVVVAGGLEAGDPFFKHDPPQIECWKVGVLRKAVSEMQIEGAGKKSKLVLEVYERADHDIVTDKQLSHPFLRNKLLSLLLKGQTGPPYIAVQQNNDRLHHVKKEVAGWLELVVAGVFVPELE